jgi:hypothetical protein
MTNKELKNILEQLEDLQQKLVEDYNDIKPFEQDEEDRLILPHVIELLKTLV